MKHFTIAELCKSDTAMQAGIKNLPNIEQTSNLIALVNNVLDPLREQYGKPIHVNSGFRCDALNKKVGGAATSQHVRGQAADITGGSREENQKLFELCKSLPFDQLINEYDFKWIHVSFKKAGNRKQILKIG